MRTAIDHPPGSPVFNALKERIEATGYIVAIGNEPSFGRMRLGDGLPVAVPPGTSVEILVVEQTSKTHGTIIAAEYSPVGSEYAGLVSIAKQLGIELED